MHQTQLERAEANITDPGNQISFETVYGRNEKVTAATQIEVTE